MPRPTYTLNIVEKYHGKVYADLIEGLLGYAIDSAMLMNGITGGNVKERLNKNNDLIIEAVSVWSNRKQDDIRADLVAAFTEFWGDKPK